MPEGIVQTLPPEFLPKVDVKKSPLWIFIILAAVILAGGGVGAYFYFGSKTVVVAPPSAPPPVELPPPPAPLVPEPTPPPPVVAPEPPPGPRVLVPAPDTDGDGLSDDEEIIYKTNPLAPDTDADNFIDGNEVFKLYSPIASGVAQLADSGLVKIFTNDKQNYSIFYPTSFTLDIIDATSTTKVAFRVATGEGFVVTALENPAQLSPLNYYLNMHPEVPITAISAANSRGGFSGVTSPDGLETILSANGKLYSFVYDVGDNLTKRFTTTYHMMINSFKLIKP